MNYSKVLPATGGTGLIVGGMLVSQAYLLLSVALVVLAAAILVRVMWRRDKKIHEL